MWRWLTVLFLTLAGVARAEPVWTQAPEPMRHATEIVAPMGGWWTEDGLYATVHGASEDRATVSRLANQAAESVPRLARELGVPAGGRIDIYVTAPGTFQDVQPGATPDWADGTAWPLDGLIFLHSPRERSGLAESLGTVLDHELVHVLVGRAFEPTIPPRWLQEGLAQVYAGELGPTVADTIAQGRVAGGLIPLATVVRGFPRDAGLARLAYAQSADFVGWIGSTYGDDALRRLVAEMRQGATAETAVLRVTGQPLDRAEAAWTQRWADPFVWVQGVLSSGILWGVLSLLLVLGGWRRWRRGREKLARWAAEEELWRRQRELALTARLELDGYRGPEVPQPRQVLEFRGPVQ